MPSRNAKLRAAGRPRPPEAPPASRAHNDDGTFKADDPSTPKVNEAFVAAPPPTFAEQLKAAFDADDEPMLFKLLRRKRIYRGKKPDVARKRAKTYLDNLE